MSVQLTPEEAIDLVAVWIGARLSVLTYQAIPTDFPVSGRNREWLVREITHYREQRAEAEAALRAAGLGG
jgi:hypothetical protein